MSIGFELYLGAVLAIGLALIALDTSVQVKAVGVFLLGYAIGGLHYGSPRIHR